MALLYSVLLFSKSDCLLVSCSIYWHVLRASTSRVQYFVKHLLLPVTTVAGSSKVLTKYPILYVKF